MYHTRSREQLLPGHLRVEKLSCAFGGYDQLCGPWKRARNVSGKRTYCADCDQCGNVHLLRIMRVEGHVIVAARSTFNQLPACVLIQQFRDLWVSEIPRDSPILVAVWCWRRIHQNYRTRHSMLLLDPAGDLHCDKAAGAHPPDPNRTRGTDGPDLLDIGQHHLAHIIEGRLFSVDAVRVNGVEGLVRP